jgi:imidazolonepropionase-like amidohydrolase
MLSERVVEALVAAAHKHRRLAVAHVDRIAEANVAVAAGVDGLVHVFVDEPVSETLLNRMRANRTFVVPTLTIRQAAEPGEEWRGNGASLLGNAAIMQHLSQEAGVELERPYVGRNGWRALAAENTKAMFERGIEILAGSDAPNPGTVWGASLHQELQLLVEAGLPAEASLRAATSNPARRFGFEDRGRIAPGLLADIVLLACDPTRDIQCTTKIVHVWRRGVRISREPARRVDRK